MRRPTVVALLSLLAISSALADPALGGGRGLFRVQDARVEEDGALVFANRWAFTTYDDSLGITGVRGPLYGLEMNYAPFPMLEMFGSLVGVFDWRADAPNFYDWQGAALGAKVSFPFLPLLKLAASGHYNYSRPTSQGYRYMDGYVSPNASYRLIGALRLWELYKTLPTVMFNWGEDVFDADTGSHFLGGGVEFGSNALDLFVEATSRTREGVRFFSSDASAAITPGVRIKAPYFHLTGGVEIGLTDSAPDYRGIVGFSIVSPFPRPPRRPFGRLAGKVQDARSGLPLAARISLSGARGGSLKTDPKNGIFYLQKAPTGVVIVEASKDGYMPDAVPLVITDGGFATYTFNLKPLVPYGTVAGRVTDAHTNKPLDATVTFTGIDVPATAANATTGFFRVDNVPAGLVNVKVEKSGYFPDEHVAEVEDGGVSKLNVALASLDMKGVFQGKVIDKKTGTGLAATISFTQPLRNGLTAAGDGIFSAELPTGSYDVKIEAAGYMPQAGAFAVNKNDTISRTYEMVARGMVLTLRGVFFEFGKATLRTESYPALAEAAQIMKDNPDIWVEIQGHTDNVGSDKGNLTLSEKRAYAVMNWLVQLGGIDAQRLTARGYGKTQPVASNDTEEGRQLNRRVDFVIAR
jgi:outer membrane protein OmpA-like peptidoglycan-associated protein